MTRLRNGQVPATERVQAQSVSQRAIAPYGQRHEQRSVRKRGSVRRCAPVPDQADPRQKVALTQHYAAAFREGVLTLDPSAPAPAPIRMPGRPATPLLVHPRDLPRRGLGTPEGRAAFIHAIAHIELNAIDLAWDAVYRFRGLPAAFYADWVAVADDESRHFMLLRARLQAHDHDYGDFAAHNGLWKCARRLHTTAWRAWPWCRACSKRAAWT